MFLIEQYQRKMRCVQKNRCRKNMKNYLILIATKYNICNIGRDVCFLMVYQWVDTHFTRVKKKFWGKKIKYCKFCHKIQTIAGVWMQEWGANQEAKRQRRLKITVFLTSCQYILINDVSQTSQMPGWFQ